MIIILILLIIAIIVFVAIKTSKSEDDTSTLADQTNKVVNVTLLGGIIGLLRDSPQNSLNRRIKKENANGWRVVQVIPADSGNIFLAIFRLLLLVITLFFYTTANGYYVIMEKK
jgi:preprotein translocase subunit YajC